MEKRPTGLARIDLSSPLPPQPLPILQALPDLALEAAFWRIVELAAAKRLGEVVLARKRVRCVVVVVVARAVAFAFHQLGRRVEDVLRRQQRTGFLGGAHRLAE